MYCVYWIRRLCHTDPLSEGYIGVSNNLARRFAAHKKSSYRVGMSIRKYDDIINGILCSNLSEKQALQIEAGYRPEERIGWNHAKGGGKPPILSLSDRKKRSSMYAGKGNPNYNKIATEATRHKMKLAQQGRPIVASGRYFKYGVDAARFYSTTAQVVSYRLKSQSAKWADWYYEDVGPVTPKPAPKRPDVALRNQSEVSRERSRKNALARWSKA